MEESIEKTKESVQEEIKGLFEFFFNNFVELIFLKKILMVLLE